MPDEIPRSALGHLEFIAEGGQGKVYAAPELTLPGTPGGLAYKEYKRNQVSPNGLRAIVAVRTRLHSAERRRLDALATWPICTVHDGDGVCGIVMPKIPQSFYEHRVLPTGKRKDKPREIQNLFVGAAKCQRLGLPLVNLFDRFAICRDLASALAFLHANNVVFGDVNAKNALYRLPGDPTVMLVDCDAVRVKGSVAVVKQLNAPDWEPPEGRTLTVQTDVYKFGLFVIRALSPGDFASTAHGPERVREVLDADGQRLLAATLDADPAARPGARAWAEHFAGRIAAAPEAARAAMTTARSSAGQVHGGWQRDPDTGRWVQASGT